LKTMALDSIYGHVFRFGLHVRSKVKLIVLGSILMAFLSVAMSGCRTIQVPMLNEALIKEIVKGKTSREQIIEDFGKPDIILDTDSFVIPVGSVLYAFRDCLKKYKNPEKYSQELNKYIESKKGHRLSEKIDTYIYVDIFIYEKSGSGGGAIGPVFIMQNKHSLIVHFNELAVFIDSKSGIVVDHAYRKEWDWEDYGKLLRTMLKKINRPVENPFSECSSGNE
jgi:hypothetical protein